MGQNCQDYTFYLKTLLFAKNFSIFIAMSRFISSSIILSTIFLAAVFTIVSCKEENSVAIEPDFIGDEYIEYDVEQFKEPETLAISYRKAYNFNKASEALVIMGQEWAEKLDRVDYEEKLKITAVYEKAQDDLMRKFGIQGKEEFKWIQTKALADPANKEIFAKAGVWSN
jgi:hypothetical protein